MRNLHLRLAVLGCCVLADCGTGQPIKREILVGSYVYKSEDPEDKPTNHNFDRLTLQADGSYDFVQGARQSQKRSTPAHGSSTQVDGSRLWTWITPDIP